MRAVPMDVDPAARLQAIMRRLRDPNGGCPWDLEQDFETIAPYTIEEAYEVADAITRRDYQELKDELGDLLLQVVYHAQIAEERGLFAFNEVAEAVCAKMIRRHPHVFGDAETADWEAIKEEERRLKAAAGAEAPRSPRRTLEGVPAALPALTRADKLQARAARVGFDWPNVRPVLDKIAEEAAEVADAVDRGEPIPRVEEEIGDLIFVVANLARHYKVDPETALRRANTKFERRFAAVEDALGAEGRLPSDATLEEMDALWDAAKARERAAS